MADDNIIHPSFQKPEPVEPRIWVCHCGCKHFELFDDGSTKCGICGVVEPHNGRWQDYEDSAPDTGYTRGIVHVGSADLAKARVLKNGTMPGAVLAVVVFEDGKISAWNGTEALAFTDEQAAVRKAWIRRQLEHAASLLNGDSP